MRTFGKGLIIAVAVIAGGCGDDDNDNNTLGDASGVTVFDVTLTTTQVSPPCVEAGALATGNVTITAADDNSVIQVNNLTFSGLSGPVTAASINQGALGTTGPVIFQLDVNVTPFSTVAFNVDNYPSPVPAGASPNFLSFVEALRAGDTYIVVSTARCPDGEIRAQIR